MNRDRFKALLGMIHVSDPSTDQPGDRLCKIRPLIAHMKQKCKELYQCKVNVSVDERMVKSKGRSGIRQFIANKPVRFGFKLWVLAESDTGYTLDFNVQDVGSDHEVYSEDYEVYSIMKVISY